MIGTMKSLWEIVRQIAGEALRDRITGEAARAAYYFFLSLFPLILAMFALTGIFGGDSAFEWIMDRLRMALPGDASVYLERFVREITGESRPGVLSFSVLFTLWSASNIFAVLADGLNRMYDLEETRAWWKRRLIAVAAFLVGSVLLVAGTVAMLASPELMGLVGLASAWELLRWPVAVVLLVLMMWLVYYLLPDRSMKGSAKPTLIGAAVGTGLWLAATLGFRFYVSHFATYGDTYGFVGGIIVLLLWLWITSLAILFGGEVAATLEQRWNPDWEVGKAPPKASKPTRRGRGSTSA
jgi:membrane protein